MYVAELDKLAGVADILRIPLPNVESGSEPDEDYEEGTLQPMEINPEFLQAVVPSYYTFYTHCYYSLETNLIIIHYLYSFTILNYNIIIYLFYNYSVQCCILSVQL